MIYTYIIRSKKDGKLYTGLTRDLRKRFIEHNSGRVSSTKNRGPFKLIYYEACVDEKDAAAREKYLKSGNGKRYIKQRMNHFLSRTGFTFVELIIVLGIFAILFAVGLPIGLDAYRNYLLNSEATSLVSFLRRAQNASLANINGSSHGIYVGADKFIIFEGATYATRTASRDQEFYRSSSVEVSGPQEIVFAPLSGNPNLAGSFVLSNLLRIQTIEINEQGTIFW